MNRSAVFYLALVAAGLLAGTSLYAESNLLWVGGVSQDFTDPANWDNGDPQGNRLFINMDTGNYPVFDGMGYAGSLNAWDFLIGSNGTQGATTSGNPGRFDQTGGTIDLNWEMQIGGTASGHSIYNMSGYSYLNKNNDGGDILVGTRSNTASGEFNLSGNATVTLYHNQFFAGTNGGTGTVTMTDNASIAIFGGGSFDLGNDHGNGTLTMTGGSQLYVNNGGNIYVGDSGGYDGTFGQGTLTAGVGTTITQEGGWFNVGSGSRAIGTVTTAGTVTLGDVLFIGRGGGSGTWSQTGGSTTVANKVYLGEWDSDQGPGVGIVNLNGGVFTTKQITYSDWRSPNIDGSQRTPATVLSTQTVNFDGGTLQASQDEPYFINPKGAANFNVYIKANGGTLNTNGFNVGLQTPLKTDAVSTGGGLTKNGAGSLTLRANNTYSGATNVNAGSLIVPAPYSLATTSVSVASGATLRLGGASTLTSPLTSLNLASGSTLAVDLNSNAATGNTISAAALANKSGLAFVLGAQGTSLDTLNVYTLIAGYNNTATATAPTVNLNIRGYAANVTVGNTATTVAISGSLASANLTWGALVTYDWDLNTTANWTGAADGKFMELDNVSFPNLGYGQDINVIGKVHPASIVISNAALPYNFNGTGSITGIGTTVTKTDVGTATFNVTGGIYYTGTTTLSGGTLEFGGKTGSTTLPGGFVFDGGALGVTSGPYDTTLTLTGSVTGTGTNGLIKTSSGTLVLAGTSNYSGPTDIRGGRVQIGSLAQLGSSSDDKANLLLGGMLHYTGATATTTRGFTGTADGAGIWIENDLTVSGEIAHTGGDFTKWGFGTLTIDQNPTATTDQFGFFKAQQGSTNLVNGVAVHVSDAWVGNMQTGNLTISQNSSFASDYNINVGASDWGPAGTGIVTLNDSAVVITGGLMVGNNNPSCTGKLFMFNDTTLHAYWGISFGETAKSTVELHNNAALSTDGRIKIGHGGSGANASVTLFDTASIRTGDTGESFDLGRDSGGDNGLLVMQGGNLAVRNSGSHIDVAGELQAGWDNHSNGTMVMMGSSYANVSGSAVFAHNTASGQLIMMENSTFNTGNDLYVGDSGGHGTLNLSGTAQVNVTNGMGLARYGSSEPGTVDILMVDASELHGGAWFNLATFSNADGKLTMKGSAWLDLGTSHTNQWSNFGYATGKATVDMSQGSRMTVANKGISLGEANGGNGSITLHDGASITVTATDATRTNTGVDNSDYDNGAFLIGARGGFGIVTLLDGSSVTGVNTDIQLGANYENGSRQAPGVGVMIVTGGSQVSTTGTGSIIIGNNGGNGQWGQYGGTTTTPNPVILGEYDIEHRNFPDRGEQAIGSGTLTLTGGVFQAPQITTHTDAAAVAGTSGTINFVGGVLRASADSANFITSDGNGSSMSLLVGSGSNSLGAILDTQSFNVTVNEQFKHDGSGPATDGGLMKIGSGMLTLTVDPAYTGNTTVNEGTLVVPNLNTPSATVYVADSGTLVANSIVADTLSIGGAVLPHTVATNVTPVPEPSSLVLLALAGVATLLAAWRRK